MRKLPLADPGTPDTRSPARYLLWVAGRQRATVIGGITFGSIWMVAQSVMPAIIGKAIDAGVRAHDMHRLWEWALVLLAAGVIQAAAGIFRHRFAVTNWLVAAYRTVQIVGRHIVRLGATLPRKVPTGEVVSIGASDIAHVGNSIEVMGRGAGAVVSFLVVSLILLRTSATLGLVVLIGMPALLLGLSPLLRPLQKRNLAQRELTGKLNSQAADIVSGLRVLRGIGGEEVFHRRYAAESQRVRDAGVQSPACSPSSTPCRSCCPGCSSWSSSGSVRGSPSRARSRRASSSRSTATRRSSCCRCRPRPRWSTR